MRKIVAITLLGFNLTGCGELDEPITFGQVGSARDVWLYGGVLGSSKVALIYGYSDDMAACQDIVKGYRLLYPENHNYFCSYE